MSKPLKILLVDDNPNDRQLVIHHLEEEFPQVEVTQIIAADGLAAALGTGAFDVVITDFQIRWTTGLEVLQAVKAGYPDCPVIMFTATGTQEIAVEAMKSGLDDYLIKAPAHYARLPVAVSSVLEKTRLVIAQQQNQADLRRKNAELELLHSLNQAVNRGEGLAQILTTLSAESKKIFDCSGVTIYLLSEDRQHLVMQFPGLGEEQTTRIEKLIRQPIPEVRIPKREGSWYWEILESGQAAITQDPKTIQAMTAELTENPTFRKLIPGIVKAIGLSSVITVPLTTIGETIGLIDTSRREPFNEADLHWMERIAGEVSAILQHQRMDVKLTASEDRYRDLVENSRDLICTHDLQGVLLIINPRVAQMLGYQINEMIGKNLREFLVPEVRAAFGDYLAEIQQHGAAQGRMYVQTRSGEQRIWEYNNTLRTEGVPEPVVRGMARDITEKFAAEEKARKWAHIFEHAEWGVVTGSADGTTLEIMNPAFAHMHGHTVEELTGQPILDVFAPESRAEVPGQIRTAHEKGHHAFESKHIRKDGSIFPVIVDVTAVKNRGGQVLYRAVNVIDITERVRAERELEERRVCTWKGCWEPRPTPSLLWMKTI
ncbi:MAG: PAS domain S-box protein [Chloroflexota bacterium]